MHPRDGRVVSNFIAQALKDEPITIFGDGSQTRSFCYVEDMVDALMRLMRTSPEVTGPINLGNPSECSVLELAQRIIELTGSRSRLVFGALPADDPRQRKPDISEAIKTLNWTPRVGLEEGLRKTVSYFDEFLRSQGVSARRG
jgi:UDP-glucuronate decarboxylase